MSVTSSFSSSLSSDSGEDKVYKKLARAVEKNKVLTRKPKASKTDPFKPVRVKTPYSLFQTEYNNKLKKDYPEMDYDERKKRISKKWKNLSDDRKKKYNKLVKKDKRRYERELNQIQMDYAKFRYQKAKRRKRST
eukprot:TRINITY_DN11868_c0_g1_i1.p1 TRINITY_DN11868_c0_g1~~TRINITY_DN11868_c0_g1_i1.p1  ORF type:complete len:135 (-),score=25.18 TRINITY_DN11868_c0_g1_i1:78-482(-)